MDGNSPATLSRRRFIVTSLTAAGGLAIGFSALPQTAQAFPLGPQLWTKSESDPDEINAYIAIEPDNTIIIRMPHAELGQGAGTALPMIVAEELECDWTKVKGEYASANRNLREKGVYHDMATVGSRGVATSWQYLQQAGASARVRLVAAAAQRWSVPVEECTAENSQVLHKASGRVLDYGALAGDAAKIAIAKEPAIKTFDQYKLIGKSLPRLDTPAKINGTAQYGIDTRLPDMVYAAVMACPVPTGKLKSVDDTAIQGRRGILQVVKLDDAVVVVADRFWRAKEAARALQIEWDTGAAGKTDSTQFRQLYLDALDEKLSPARNDGDTAKALAQGKVIEAVYEAPYLAHAPMEPLNATVHLQADRLDVWIGSQMPPAALKLAAAVSGLPPEQVYIHNCYVGGGFGRRSMHDELHQAVAVAKIVGKPLKLVWTREQDIQRDRFRPQAAVRFKAVLGADGMPVALDSAIAVSSINRSLGTNPDKSGSEPQAIDGIANISYKIPNQHVGVMLKNTHVPVMFWRSVGGSQNCFFMESFIDELAHAAGKDPIAYRRAMLDRKDFLGVLKTLEEKSDWHTPLPAGRGRGIAITENHGGILGHVAEVTVNAAGAIRVDRIVAAIDCYHAVNPGIIETQVQGGIIFGLSAALYGEITFKNGAAMQDNFDSYRVVRLADAPKIEVYLSLSGGNKFGGVGEPGVAPLAPAVANAIFAATGKRIRALPLKNQSITLASAQ